MPASTLLTSATNMFEHFLVNDVEQLTGLAWTDEYRSKLNQIQAMAGTIDWSSLDTEEVHKTAKLWGKKGLLHLASYSKIGVDAVGAAVGLTGNIPVMAALTILGEVVESTIKSYADNSEPPPIVAGDWVIFDLTGTFRRRVFGEDNLDYWTLETLHEGEHHEIGQDCHMGLCLGGGSDGRIELLNVESGQVEHPFAVYCMRPPNEEQARMNGERTLAAIKSFVDEEPTYDQIDAESAVRTGDTVIIRSSGQLGTIRKQWPNGALVETNGGEGVKFRWSELAGAPGNDTTARPIEGAVPNSFVAATGGFHTSEWVYTYQETDDNGNRVWELGVIHTCKGGKECFVVSAKTLKKEEWYTVSALRHSKNQFRNANTKIRAFVRGVREGSAQYKSLFLPARYSNLFPVEEIDVVGAAEEARFFAVPAAEKFQPILTAPHFGTDEKEQTEGFGYKKGIAVPNQGDATEFSDGESEFLVPYA